MPAIEKRSTIIVTAPSMKPNMWSNDRRCQYISSSDRRRPTRSCGSSPLATVPKPACRRTNAGWRTNRQTHRVRCPRHRVEHRGVIVTHREILDDANDFMPSAFALRATADRSSLALRTAILGRGTGCGGRVALVRRSRSAKAGLSAVARSAKADRRGLP